MNKSSKNVATANPNESKVPASYGVRHASGAWFNHRVKGLLVDNPKHAMTWTSQALAGAVAAMLNADDRYEVVPLPA